MLAGDSPLNDRVDKSSVLQVETKMTALSNFIRNSFQNNHIELFSKLAILDLLV